MWCCFKAPKTKIPEVSCCLEILEGPLEKAEQSFSNTDALEVSERSEDPPVPDSTEVITDMVEPFVLDHSTILMTECEKPIN